MGRQYRLKFVGGICLNGYRIVYQQAEKVDADSIAGFLSHLRKCNPGKYKIHIIWDNAGYHCDQSSERICKELSN